MSPVALEVRDLSVAYGPSLILDGVNIEIADGGSTCLLGANGAGKTTLLRAVSGLLAFHGGRVVGGEVRLWGQRVTASDPSRLVARGVAQVLEGRRVFANLTVGENLRAGGLRRRASRASATTDGVLDLFPALAVRMDQPAGLLSGGEQQMLAIARALMSDPRLLLLDEPSLGLAPLVIRAIGAALAEINGAGVALLLAEQSSALARSVARDGYLLENGRLRTSGAVDWVLEQEQLRSAYLGPARPQPASP